jgi:hypothetical protein
VSKLEELKAEAEAADTAALDAWDNARADAWDAFEAAHGGALWDARSDAWGAYQAELKKQENPNE